LAGSRSLDDLGTDYLDSFGDVNEMSNQADLIIAKLYPPIREAAQDFIKEAEGIGAFLYQGYRSLDEQKALYAQGRTVPGDVVTDARAGLSLHNYGLAMDLTFLDAAGNPSWAATHDWKTLGRIGKKHGWEWGGDWRDPYIRDLPHFQIDYGIDVRKLYAVYAKTWLLADVWTWLSNERGHNA
jgi:peptidoglycan L-alanyl-D-glutamate endopeptidase CwlK